MSMDRRQEIFARIADYQSGLLDPDEKSEVERMLAADPVWQEEARIYKALMESGKALVSNEIRARMRQWRNEEPGQVETPVIPLNPQIPKAEQHESRKLRFYQIAAGIAILIALSLALPILWKLVRPNDALQNAFADAYQPAQPLPVLSGPDVSPFREANNAFRDGAYSTSKRLYLELLADPKFGEGDTILYFLGHSELALGDAGTAIGYFSQLKEGNGLYKQDAEWYMALCLLKLSQVELCRKALQQIVNTQGHRRAVEARQVLMAIKQEIP